LAHGGRVGAGEEGLHSRSDTPDGPADVHSTKMPRNLMKYHTPALCAILALAACKSTTPAPSPDAASDPTGHAPIAVSTLVFPAQAGWIEEEPTSDMRHAQFRLPAVPGDDEDAQLVVYYFGGGGSWEANVERWCGQFEQTDGRDSMEVAVQSERMVAGLPAREIEVSGTYVAETFPGSDERVNNPRYSMIGGRIEGSEGSWYPKLVGPARTVRQWEASYRRFLDAVRPAGE
jgi:hypothetical protein